ncbi:MAG: hypothetical protein ACJA1A_001755 [Saprospiraceae bacterium]|jgi:hypothetical protein|tara:strand:+ start:1412 stop:2203 length:792 start_codon:yes stop_codon:yes gene_type:complete
MKIISISCDSQMKIDRIFGMNEAVGLYFKRSWGSGVAVSDVYKSDFLTCYSINAGSTKKVQLSTNKRIVVFDNFRPKNNLQYYIHTSGDKQINAYYFENKMSYSECQKYATNLISQGFKVLISEQHCKLKSISSSEERIHAFHGKKSNADIFFYHTSSATFSDLVTQEENEKLDLNDIFSWYPMGHSNLNILRRVAYFLFGKLTKLGNNSSHKGPYGVYSKLGAVDSFGNYQMALDFCSSENDKGEAGSEFLICEIVNSMSWH